MKLSCLVLALALPTSASAVEIPSWLSDQADDARWLAEAPGQPRAILQMEEGTVQVTLYVPQISAEDIVKTVLSYDVYKRTDAVEAAFEADGAFFTATRVLGQFSPTITEYTIARGGDGLTFSWKRMPGDKAIPWLRQHRDRLAQVLNAAGLTQDPDRYIEEVADRYDVLAEVVGSHRYEGGFYRYSQQATTRSRFAQRIMDGLGTGMQVAAALKAACYSIGKYDWAGPAGQKGVEFEARGNMGATMRPSK